MRVAGFFDHFLRFILVILNKTNLIKQRFLDVIALCLNHVLLHQTINLGKRNFIFRFGITVKESYANIDQVKHGDEFLIHLTECEVQCATDVDILDLAGNGCFLALFATDLIVGVDFHITFSGRRSSVLFCR